MRSKYSLPVILLISVSFLLFTNSCKKDTEVRSYEEKIKKNELPANMHGQGIDIPSGSKSNFNWDSPEGWVNVKNDSKLRLATFSLKSENKEAVCTIIPLSGDGGGLKANVQMWLSSITEKSFSENELNEFLLKQKKFKTADNHDGIFIDFTTITGKGSDHSIVVSVIDFPGKTIFIKLTGDSGIVKDNSEKVFILSKSLKSGE